MPFDGIPDNHRDGTLLVLRLARDFVVAGWAQGSFCTSVPQYDGRVSVSYCALGALRQAFNIHQGVRLPWVGESEHPADFLAGEHLHRALPLHRRLTASSRCNPIVVYNDGKRRRKRHIVALFDRAIAAEQKRLAAQAAPHRR